MAKTLKWATDGEILPNGNVGGDVQAGESHSVQFFPVSEPRDDLHAVVTVSCYPAIEPDDERRDTDFPYLVQEQVEFTICTDLDDIGGTEVYSDIQYEDSGMGFETLEEASSQARQWANSWARNVSAYLAWDGRSRIGE